MVGVWVMCLWEQMGRPEGVNLVELGPGRGTLMADLLRVCNLNHIMDMILYLNFNFNVDILFLWLNKVLNFL
jgi:NADH dehydrogenase [ubiquinone] 1 alpha subcomplex assembly factor 7